MASSATGILFPLLLVSRQNCSPHAVGSGWDFSHADPNRIMQGVQNGRGCWNHSLPILIQRTRRRIKSRLARDHIAMLVKRQISERECMRLIAVAHGHAAAVK